MRYVHFCNKNWGHKNVLIPILLGAVESISTRAILGDFAYDFAYVPFKNGIAQARSWSNLLFLSLTDRAWWGQSISVVYQKHNMTGVGGQSKMWHKIDWFGRYVTDIALSFFQLHWYTTPLDPSHWEESKTGLRYGRVLLLTMGSQQNCTCHHGVNAPIAYAYGTHVLEYQDSYTLPGY